jgi:hypothetical protein
MMQPFKEVCSVMSSHYFSLVPYRFNGEAGFKYRKSNLNLSYVLSIEEKSCTVKRVQDIFWFYWHFLFT